MRLRSCNDDGTFRKAARLFLNVYERQQLIESDETKEIEKPGKPVKGYPVLNTVQMLMRKCQLHTEQMTNPDGALQNGVSEKHDVPLIQWLINMPKSQYLSTSYKAMQRTLLLAAP